MELLWDIAPHWPINGVTLWAMAGVMYFTWLLVVPADRWPEWWRTITDPAAWKRLLAQLPRSTLLRHK